MKDFVHSKEIKWNTFWTNSCDVSANLLTLITSWNRRTCVSCSKWTAPCKALGSDCGDYEDSAVWRRVVWWKLYWLLEERADPIFRVGDPETWVDLSHHTTLRLRRRHCSYRLLFYTWCTKDLRVEYGHPLHSYGYLKSSVYPSSQSKQTGRFWEANNFLSWRVGVT